MRINYLSERVYEENEKEGKKNLKYEYWSKILGEEVSELLYDQNFQFRGYIQENQYEVMKPDIYKRVEDYLSSMKNFQGIKNPKFFSKVNKEIIFPEFYYSMVERGIEILEKKIEAYSTQITENIYTSFALYMARQMQEVSIRTLITSMHLYKEQGKLKGRDEKEEYEFFCNTYVGTWEFKKELFHMYPVLWRCLEEKAKQVINYYAEVITNFVKDRVQIQKKFSGDCPVNRITDINFGFSDIHSQGKSVLQVTIDNGLKLMYKPRCMDNEKFFYGTLNWLSEKMHMTQYTYTILSYQDHSWCEQVVNMSCSSEEQVKAYYKRLGIQLFLVYFFGTRDLHFENIIASGEYPVLIDLESLINIPRVAIEKGIEGEMYHRLEESVLYSGLLPFHFGNIDPSGICGQGEQKYSFMIPVIVDSKTSNMRIGYKYPTTKTQKNLVQWKGKVCEAVEYKEYLLNGFEVAYRQTLKNVSEFKKILETAGYLRNRSIIMHTQRYTMLLSSSYHPSLMRDGAERELFLYSMWKGRGKGDEALVKAEIQDLLNGDIPYFYCQGNSTCLFQNNKEIYPYFLSDTASSHIIKKCKKLSVDDMEIQKEYIRLSLEIFSQKHVKYINHTYSIKNKIQKDEFVGEAVTRESLKRKLLQHAIWNPEKTEVNWFTMKLSDEQQKKWEIVPMNHYFYDGLAGMLLVFYELNQKEKNTEIFYKTLKNMLCEYTEQGILSLNNLDSHNTGLYNGEASIVYVYLLMYQISGEEEYLEYAKKHAQIVAKLLKSDQQYDWLTGNAGAAWGFILLYRLTGAKEYLQLGEDAIQVLSKFAKVQEQGIAWENQMDIPPMSGLAHGNSGMLLPVLALAKYTHLTQYEELAKQIWEYEDSLFDSSMNNWKDTRIEVNSEEAEQFMPGSVAWCHGAAGILYSRILCYEFLENEEWKRRIERDIRRAYTTLKVYWQRDSYRMCHGTYGNLWILAIAERQMKEYGIKFENDEEVEIHKAGDIRLLPQERINPGFMNGYSGVLYANMKLFKDNNIASQGLRIED